MSTLSRRLSVPAIGAILVAFAGSPAIAGSLDSSRADALSGQFMDLHIVTNLPPVALVQGGAPPAYSKSVSRRSYDKVLDIANPSTQPPAALYSNLQGISDHVAGSGIGVDSYGSEGDSKIASASLSLNLDPPPPGADAAPMVPLSIVATNIRASANYSVVVPQPPVATGSTSFGNLVVTGSLVDNKHLSFVGTPAPNTVLFSDANVTITLNQQLIVASTVTCVSSPGCTVSPERILVDAVHVTLNNASIFGRIVSGDFGLGEAQAGS